MNKISRYVMTTSLFVLYGALFCDCCVAYLRYSSSPLLSLSTQRFLDIVVKKTVKVEDYELTRGDVCGMLEKQVKTCGI